MNKIIKILPLLLLCTLISNAQTYDTLNVNLDLDKINKELDNPLSRYWSLVFQENLSIKSGNLIEGNHLTNTFFFQPALPVPIGKKFMFTARPVFPIVTNPTFNTDGTIDKSTTGFGDIQMLTLFGPDKKGGLIWGVGLTFVFPTATANNLGRGKYQMGPSFMLMSMTKKWTLGLVGQHWGSFAGDESRDEVSQTDIQYLIRKRFPGAMSLGVGPTVTVDWRADKGQMLIFPIGFGIVKTVKVAGSAYKIKIEPQYNIIRPDNYSATWTFRLQITPVIKSPFLN